MQNTKVKVIAIILVLLPVWFAFAGGATEADTDVLEITFAHDTTLPHPTAFFADRFSELVAEKSGGSIKVDVLGSGELGSAEETVQQVQEGIIEMSNLGSPIVRFLADYGAFELPFLFRSRDHAFAVADGPIGQELSDKLAAETGLRMLVMAENGWRQISNSVRPIYKPSDLEGLRIRTPNSPVRIKMFETLGAAATPMPFTELYSALQQGVVDGQENPLGNILGASLQEVQSYLSITNHVYSLVSFLIGENFWQSLSADQQAILVEAAREAREAQVAYAIDIDNNAIGDLSKAGMEVNETKIELFQEAVRPVWESYPEWINLVERIQGVQ
jgi:tripartite ATP-independent transporter DctP family solute receptor